MCILYVKISENPENDEYRLILANVRDEHYERPTKVCSFWDNYPNLIGAKDLQKDRGEGTWMCMNTNGKISVLLNILQPENDIDHNKKSRGHLVVDYLIGEHSPESYLNHIAKESQLYNGFIIVAINMNMIGIQGSYYSNLHNCDPKTLSYDVHAFGNNLYPNEEWPKVRYGKQRFQQIIDKHCKINDKEKLIDEIYNMFFDRTIFPLDDQMKAQGKGKPIQVLERLNSLYVEIPEANYGSRTWTIILIDAKGNVDYYERTMKEPINILNKEWINTHKSFVITDQL